MDNELEELVQDILELYSKYNNWQAVGDHYDVPKIVVWRIANDSYEPKKNEIRSRLGLSEIIEVHQKRDKKGRFIRKLK